MDKLIRQSWWKALAVLILLYVFVVGLLVPLKPNITTVQSTDAVAGKSVEMIVTGYNTDFEVAKNDWRAWLFYKRQFQIKAKKVEVLGPQIAKLYFDLPAEHPDEKKVITASLAMDNPKEGHFSRPSALSIVASQDSALNTAVWSKEFPNDLHVREGMTFPFRNILAETIRNLYFHVALWLAMMFLFIAALVYAIKYLRLQRKMGKGGVLDVALEGVSPRERADFWSQALTGAGLMFGILGLVTGALWAKYTWGSWWSWDIKQFTTLIALLIYAGYFVLRSSFTDPEARGRISAVYNIFAFAALIPLIYVLPRLSDSSLHPGNGGNPALSVDDLDNTMRMVFYPAVIGWTLMGGWLASIFYRIKRLEKQNW